MLLPLRRLLPIFASLTRLLSEILGNLLSMLSVVFSSHHESCLTVASGQNYEFLSTFQGKTGLQDGPFLEGHIIPPPSSFPVFGKVVSPDALLVATEEIVNRI